jgi:radical SAM protein with 4Fe4S-binding SPASM domain
MSVDMFAGILEQAEPYTSHVYLHVKGEPLLHPQIDTLLDICHQHRIQVVLVTNGTMLCSKGNMLLSKPALRQVNISLHCYSELPKHLSKTEYVNSIVGFVQNILTNTKVIVSLRFWNIEKGRGDTNADNLYLLEEIQQHFAPHLVLTSQLKPQKGLKLHDQLYVNSDFEFAWPSLDSEGENLVGFCHGLRDQLAILSDGTVVPCCLDAEGVIGLGNIQNNSLSDILGSDRALSIYNGFSNGQCVEPLCRKCMFKQKFE